MIIKSVNLETVCGITSKLPDNEFPEVAFAGKSNVGKSSLINALMNRKSYARVSAQPGKTQTINYYNINEELYYVDLPGYGYAKVTESVKEQWGAMIERYLHTSKQLKLVFLLIDIRHKPSKNDVMMYDWIVHNGYHPVIIATKSDKLKRSQLPKHVRRSVRNSGSIRRRRSFRFLRSQSREEMKYGTLLNKCFFRNRNIMFQMNEYKKDRFCLRIGLFFCLLALVL